MPIKLSQWLIHHKSTIFYGISLALLLFVLKWFELQFAIRHNAKEIYIGAIALFFTGLGIWLSNKLTKPKVKTTIIEKEVFVYKPNEFVFNEVEATNIGLSKREIEVLNQMANGLSNNEIAENLFVSLSTVKTHTANLFFKMEVQRRTQAIEKAKRLSLIP
jgi:two-component system, NarL family, response regulator LiaR